MSRVHSTKSRKTERTKGQVKRGAKKGGGGGKYTFGRPGDEYIDEIDPADPIYDPILDGDETYVFDTYEAPAPYATVAHKVGEAFGEDPRTAGGAFAPDSRTTLSEYKRQVMPIIREFFQSEDTDEFARSIKELNIPFFTYELVKRCMTMSMDKTDRERELVSCLFSELYGDLFTKEQIAKGFTRLFELADDLLIDIPDATESIANFLARTVIDDILPPAFLSDPVVVGLGGSIVEKARVLLSMKRSGSRLEHVWSKGASAPIPELKRDIQMLVQEYVLSEDLPEAARCVRELNVPHFHHEVVKRGMVVAMDKDARACELVSSLFTFLYSQEVTSAVQLHLGFDRVKEALSDITLDNPQAGALFGGFVARGTSDGWLPESYSAE